MTELTPLQQTQVDPRERRYLSPYSTTGFGLSLGKDGEPADADGPVSVTMHNEATQEEVISREASLVSTGLYELTTSSKETAQPGDYTVTWNYSMESVPQTYVTFLTIGQPSPAYDMLSEPMKEIVDITWLRFADLFDSPDGGPNLMTYFQTHYSRGRMAELMRIALGTLNTTAQPFQTYTLDGVGGATFPFAKWGALLERSLYIEAIKHLIRSYVEQPLVVVGGQVTRLDRRDYMDRWRMVLEDEMATFKGQLDIFKISSMGLGKPAVLISGGAYGRYAPTRVAGSIAARPRVWARMH